MEAHFFENFLAIMAASLVATILLRRLNLPNIIAYLLAGCVIGPHVFGWVEDPSDFVFLAEFGVVFLLFSLGLEFSLPKLIALRRSVFGLGGIQVAFCSLVFGGAVWLWGTSVEAAIVIAGALALSSTAIVTKEISALRQVHTRHGQLSIGVLLFQDLAAVIFLIIVPVLGEADSASITTALRDAFAKGIILMVLLLAAGKWVLPLLYREVARAQSEEVFVLSTLVIVMLASWLTHSFHLSMALGGFVIGMMLGESHYRHQINSDIRGFKDILLGLFFVTIGMDIQAQLVLEYWPRLLAFTGALILIKALLIGFLVRLFGDKNMTALQTGLNLAQAGEFGLALLALGVLHGVLPGEQASFIILVAIFSMAASPLLIRRSETIGQLVSKWTGSRMNKITEEEAPIDMPHIDHVIIGGFGRVGSTIASLLEANNVDYLAIDNDEASVSKAVSEGHHVVYGDSTRLDILHQCQISTARLAVLTFHSIESARNTIEQIRSGGIDVPVIVRCYELGDYRELIELGADHVVPERLESSLMVGAEVMKLLDVAEPDIDEFLAIERERQLN